MNVKIKVNNERCVPTRGTTQSSGYDLKYDGDVFVHLPAGKSVSIPTGVFIELPEGYEAQIRPRSGLSFRQDIDVVLGTIDCDYRGEIRVKLRNFSDNDYIITPYERIAQMVIAKYESPQIMIVESLETNTQRGDNGFGHTGKN